MPVDRRSFFKRFVAESISAVEELKGIPQYRLDEIHKLPKEAIKAIVPVPLDGGAYLIDGACLVKRGAAGGEMSIVREFTPGEMAALRLFDGESSLESIADALPRSVTAMDDDKAFALVKRLFIELARLMVYVPEGKPDTEMAAGEGEER
jgi:hypothetical protein